MDDVDADTTDNTNVTSGNRVQSRTHKAEAELEMRRRTESHPSSFSGRGGAGRSRGVGGCCKGRRRWRNRSCAGGGGGVPPSAPMMEQTIHSSGGATPEDVGSSIDEEGPESSTTMPSVPNKGGLSTAAQHRGSWHCGLAQAATAVGEDDKGEDEEEDDDDDQESRRCGPLDRVSKRGVAFGGSAAGSSS